MIRGRRASGGLLAAALLLGCGGPDPELRSTPGGPPSAAATASPSASALADLPTPGRPLDAAVVLAAMRASRRPGGVPGELQTEAIAARVAEAVWTIDGQAWDVATAGGTCGPQVCTLELQGARDGATGTDAWAFAVDPATGSVEVVQHTLAALPAELVTELDLLARGDGSLGELVLASTRWLGPEDPERFVLSYRGGDEEESCSADVSVDAAAGLIVDVARSGC